MLSTAAVGVEDKVIVRDMRACRRRGEERRGNGEASPEEGKGKTISSYCCAHYSDYFNSTTKLVI